MHKDFYRADVGCGQRLPGFHDALEFARSGDTLIVWKLDRLARSMKQLITPQQQKEARQRRAEGATLKELAKSYNVGRVTISRLGA